MADGRMNPSELMKRLRQMQPVDSKSVTPIVRAY